MINKKEKFLKNYLNYEKFKKSLSRQQNMFIELYTKENLNRNQNVITNIISPKEMVKCENLLSNISQKNNLNNSLENNSIYRIRLEQAKGTLIELSKRKWPNIPICKNILELKGNVKIIFILII